LQGFPEDWTIGAERIVKSSFRWKLVGNAVTVNVCEWIAGGLKHPCDVRPGLIHEHGSGRWPDSAYGSKGKVWRVEGAFGPFARSSLAEFLKHPVKPLSHRAITGFISRAEKGNLNYPEGFISALEKYANTL
jgi:DNA (cytosine-5)-methyltransferase 1